MTKRKKKNEDIEAYRHETDKRKNAWNAKNEIRRLLNSLRDE
jgi:hypothetical protein